MKIAVFGHDAGHANLQRRIAAMQALGHEVVGMTMRRGADTQRAWRNIDLGQTFDARFAQRIQAIGTGVQRARSADLSDADLFWARNLDMLMVAVTARRNPSVPIIYETLDIHPLLYGKGLTSAMLRQTEKQLLRRVARIVVSAPAFTTEYYDHVHPDHPEVFLLENLLNLAEMPPRPPAPHLRTGPVRLGWVGVLRCNRSLSILTQLAAIAPHRVEVHLFGAPARTEIPDFDSRVAAAPGLTYHGPYHAPDDLEAVYGALDVVWAGDFTQTGGNSEWLLPNRLYEGGYFGVPALAPAGTATAAWITDKQCGWVVPSPVEPHLRDVIHLIAEDGALWAAQQRLLHAPTKWFAAGPHALQEILEVPPCR